MNFQPPPQVMQQQQPSRMDLANAMQQGGGMQQGLEPLNSFLQSKLMGNLMANAKPVNSGPFGFDVMDAPIQQGNNYMGAIA